jgi:hypothetical protein
MERPRPERWIRRSRELAVDRGELTPSLKVRRGAVVEKYAVEIDGLYGS